MSAWTFDDVSILGITDRLGTCLRICEFASDETLRIEHSVCWVHGHLIFGAITNEALSVGERHEGRGRSVALILQIISALSLEGYF